MSLLRRVVVVGNKPQIRDIAQEIAAEVFMADDLAEALDIVNTVTPDMTVFDETFPPDRVRQFLRETDNDPNGSCVNVLAASEGTSFSEREYARSGITHCLIGQENLQRLHEIAAQMQQRGAQSEAGGTTGDYFVSDVAAAVAMVGHSKAVRTTVHMIQLVAQSQCNPILIVGETGTGKELAARAIHAIRHPAEPFVAINCAALTANLLESELFGHVKGSFTGADRDKTGLLELAGRGTIFLDEISEMPLDLQAKLLRVLQERTFRKVGGVTDLACAATVIASSNRNLKKEVQERRFRQDVYYRLNICPITLAPLRSHERRKDIGLLVGYFLETSKICGDRQDRVTAITRLALEALYRHLWPGNVRELRNVIERAILLETTDTIGLNSIVIDPMDNDAGDSGASGGQRKDFSLEKAERELIARALHETGWQKTQAASLLGITRATLYAKVKQYNIQKGDARQSETDGMSLPAPPEAVPVA